MKFDFVSDTYTSGNYLDLEFDIAKVSLSLKMVSIIYGMALSIKLTIHTE